MSKVFTRADDLRDLEILARRDAGMTALEAGRGFGRGRGSVIGFETRVRGDCEKHPSTCTKPENQDGGMPAGWWRT